MKYLCVGHVCMDQDDKSGLLPGGTACYASLVAKSLDVDVSVLTAFGEDYCFTSLYKGIELINTLSDQTTIFRNNYNGEDRIQYLIQKADDIKFENEISRYENADIIHICPIAWELDLEVIDYLPDTALKLITPQGWMRVADSEGMVLQKNLDWKCLSSGDVIVISETDVNANEENFNDISMHLNLLIVTRGSKGASVFEKGIEHYYPVKAIDSVDPTGAGDSFAAAFAISYIRNADIERSIDFAQSIASLCVSARGLSFLDSVGKHQI